MFFRQQSILQPVRWAVREFVLFLYFHLRPDAVGPHKNVGVDLASVLQVNRHAPGGGVFVGGMGWSVQLTKTA